MIHGVHPEGMNYERSPEVPPVIMPFEAINWPGDQNPPQMVAAGEPADDDTEPDDAIIRQYGTPVVAQGHRGNRHHPAHRPPDYHKITPDPMIVLLDLNYTLVANSPKHGTTPVRMAKRLAGELYRQLAGRVGQAAYRGAHHGAARDLDDSHAQPDRGADRLAAPGRVFCPDRLVESSGDQGASAQEGRFSGPRRARPRHRD